VSSIDSLRGALADRYTIERELGQGGMATVYLAHDLKHERNVAIKVLHPDLGAALGGERFLSEIRTTAKLQHPHILPLLDSGDADGLLYYVMPLVTGETLRARLDREQQLPVADAVLIAREVADALGHAHGMGVIHRDIKPENILLQGGHALVADFGIALAVQQAGGARMTQTGLSLGTPQYMSPEQAMGERAIDARSDIYALGAVTYEMLTGEAPFTGPSVQAIVARLITEEPRPLVVQRKAVPGHVEAAVLRALEKLPADRFASAAEFVAGLTDPSAPTAGMRSYPVPAHASRLMTLLAPLVGMAGIAIAAWALLRPTTPGGPAVYDVGLPDSARMSFVGSVSRIGPYGALVRNLSIAPDGGFVVYAANVGDSTALWYRSLETAEARLLPGTVGATGPRLSPDGAQVGYFEGDRVMLAAVEGREPRQLMIGLSSSAIGWRSPTALVVVDNDGYRLNLVEPGAGEPRTSTIPRCVLGMWDPDLGRLICSFNGVGAAIDPETGAATTIRTVGPDGAAGAPVAGTAFRVVDRRYLVFLAADGSLSAAAYDPERQVAGRSVSLLTGVRREALGDGQFDLAADGTLVFAPGLDATVGHLVRVRPGTDLELLPMEAGDFQRYDLSADGRWLAAVTQGTELNELRIYDLRDGQRFVWQRAEAVRHAVWSPAGDQLLYVAQAANRWSLIRGAPGSGLPLDTLASTPADGSFIDPIGYPSDSVAIGQDWNGSVVVRFDPRASAPRFDTVLTGARFPSVSPNQRLIAYQTLEASRIVVTGFPTPGRRWQVASQGVEPIWLSGTELLYRFGASWYLAKVDPVTGEPLGAATFWARDPRFSDTSGWSNRPAHDGGILYVQSPEQPSPAYLRVIPGWVAQMKRAVDEGNR
jgi:serine/threonine-protein kinase